MKKLTTLLIAVCLSTALFAQNLKALDDKYGFREARFEMPFSSFKNLMEVEPHCYESTTENLKVGEYTLDRIIYIFYKDQLFAIMIKTEGYTNSRGFLKILQEAYGKGYQGNRYIEQYFWFGAKVTMSYGQNSITDDASIMMMSWKLSLLREADKKQTNSEAAKKL